ncbi:MAG TPA: UDP-N-acetylmuramoyl-L-alanyl-D-glutamate--2,6-diaminopimelate ligase, partial [Opitutales bacterium]|nr:UDP-N-acetylmuramoyl-L-alanyl-D-glutamate--2,6-diaminopimelate ligase [Opitutales bacterium]
AARGAAAFLTEEVLPEVSLPQIQVSDARRALATVSRRFFGCPDQEIALIGVTGTNGKTTTSQLCAHLLRPAFRETASMGTLGVFLGSEKIEEGEYTTDLAHVQNRRLRRLADSGVGAAAMEVSSHALTLDRVAELRFRVAIFTNLARDHLDFHGSAEAYAEAKRKLFRELPANGIAAINADDQAAASFAEACSARVISYSADGLESAEVRAEEIELSPRETRFCLTAGGRKFAVVSPLIGRFQVDNILAAATVVFGLGLDLEAALERLASFLPVPGRMEKTALPNGATAVIDFAHNPDGLANLLLNCRRLAEGRIHLVFGCGGDRDRGKRAIMGHIAAKGTDVCWVTSDNPRTENPERIAADILKSFNGASSAPRVELDREMAIRKAYAETRAGDLLVVAGKGHERYQLIGTRKIPFCDREVLGRCN